MTKEHNSHKKTIIISLTDANFDAACEQARNQSLQLYGINEDGHSNLIKEFKRSENEIIIEFEKCCIALSMEGTNFKYLFTAQIN